MVTKWGNHWISRDEQKNSHSKGIVVVVVFLVVIVFFLLPGDAVDQVDTVESVLSSQTITHIRTLSHSRSSCGKDALAFFSHTGISARLSTLQSFPSPPYKKKMLGSRSEGQSPLHTPEHSEVVGWGSILLYHLISILEVEDVIRSPFSVGRVLSRAEIQLLNEACGSRSFYDEYSEVKVVLSIEHLSMLTCDRPIPPLQHREVGELEELISISSLFLLDALLDVSSRSSQTGWSRDASGVWWLYDTVVFENGPLASDASVESIFTDPSAFWMTGEVGSKSSIGFKWEEGELEMTESPRIICRFPPLAQDLYNSLYSDPLYPVVDLAVYEKDAQMPLRVDAVLDHVDECVANHGEENVFLPHS